MELPLHVIIDKSDSLGTRISIVDDKAVIQFLKFVGANDVERKIYEKANLFVTAVNFHDRMVDFLNQATKQFEILQDHAEQEIDNRDDSREDHLAAQSQINTFLTYKNFGRRLLKKLEE